MTKRFTMLRMLLTAPLLALVSVVAMADDFTVDGISYTIVDSLAQTCEVGSNTTLEGEVTIPGQVTVNDTTYTVVGVGAKAFQKATSMTKIVLSDSITYIGNYAFDGCTALTECTLSANLDSLGGYSFRNCSLLVQDLDLSSLRVTSYSEFLNCKGITGVKFSEKLETLGSMAFDGCSNLTGEISFPGLVSLNGQYTFRNTAITGVTLPASLTAWSTSGYTFNKCTKLEYVVFEEGFSADIPSNAFNGCSSLKEVTIPEGVTSLAIKSFYDCTSLTTVTLPATLSTIKNMVFQSSDAIEDVYVYGTTPPSGNTSALFDDATLSSAALHTLPGYETTWTSNKYWAFGIAVDDINNPDTMSVAGYITSVTPEEGYVDSLASVAITFSSDIAVGVNAATYGKVKDADGNKVSGVSLSIDSDVLTVALDSTLTVDGTYTVTIPKSALTAKSGTLLSADTLTYTYTIGEETPDKWLEEGDTVLSDDGLIMLVYELDGTAGKLYVAKQSFEGELVIPGTFEYSYGYDYTLTVDSITKSAFINDSTITTLYIPNTVKGIGVYAFRGSDITSVEFEDGDTPLTLGSMVFGSCKSLASVTLPGRLSVIPSSTFLACSALSEVTIPEGVTTIEKQAFGTCTGLTSIEIPGTVKSLNGFNACTSLANVTLNEGIESIEDYAFVNDSVALKSITIPSTVKYLSGFQDCWALETLDLSSATIEEIGNNAFYKAKSLTSVDLNEGLTDIGQYAFASSAIESVTFPSTLKTIGYGAFYNTSIKYVELGDSVTTIGGGAFMDDNSLNVIKLSKQLASVDLQAFADCAAVISVYSYTAEPPTTEVSGTLDSDEQNCLFSETALANATLHVPAGSKETYLANRYWQFGTVVEDADEDPFVLHVGDTIWTNDDKLALVVHEIDAYDAYVYVAKQSFEGELVIPGNFVYYDYSVATDSITKSAFINDSTITTLYIPNTVKGIGVYAFRGSEITSVEFEDGDTPLTLGSMVFGSCGSLASVTLPGRLSVIPSSTFLACSALSEVTIPEGVTTIEKQAFGTCTGLTSIEIPGTVKSLNGFNACTSLATVTLNEGIESIEDYAFVNDSLVLTSITIPSTVTYLSGFQNCWALSEVNLESTSVTEIGDYAFYNCKSLPIIELNEGLESIGQYAFAKAQLDSVTFPSTLKTIDMGAFYGTSVYAVTLPESLTTLGYGAFLGCSSLVIVSFPEGIESVALCAFDECYALQDVVVVAANPPSTDNSLLDSDDQDMIFTSTTLDTATLHVIEGATENYTSNKYWAFATVLEDALSDDIATAIEGVSATGDAAFSIDAAGNISFAGLAEGSTVAIYNAAGQLVTRATASGNGTIAAALRSGSVYIVKVESNGESTVQKIAF